MSPGIRKPVLATHIAVSVGWVGAVVAYLPFDLAATTSDDPQTLQTAYLAMDMIASSVIVPLALASLLTGLIVSLGTKWGLFRHYWVLISLVLTAIATAVLLVETRTIGAFAQIAADPATSGAELRALGGTLLHSIGGMFVLLVVLVLNVYKPQGLTRHGWRKQEEQSRASRRSRDKKPRQVSQR